MGILLVVGEEGRRWEKEKGKGCKWWWWCKGGKGKSVVNG